MRRASFWYRWVSLEERVRHHHGVCTLFFEVKHFQLFLRLVCPSLRSFNFATLRCRISARGSCTIRESLTPELVNNLLTNLIDSNCADGSALIRETVSPESSG